MRSIIFILFSVSTSFMFPVATPVVAPVATWVAWSIGVRAWTKRKFQGIAVASAATNGVNATEMGALVAGLPIIAANSGGNVLWHGDIDLEDGWRSGGRALSVEICNGFGVIYGRPNKDRPLDALVFERNQLEIIEDVGERLVWDKALQTATRQLKLEHSTELFNGDWTFCYRDYVDYEEENSMARRRVVMALITQVDDTVLTFDDDNAKLEDLFRIFGIVPLRLEWCGYRQGDMIEWTTSSIRIGWSKFGKTIYRPTPAEIRRKIPWRIYGPHKSYLVVERVIGGGLSVYRRRTCASSF